jgi:sensor histidine kinase YesM
MIIVQKIVIDCFLYIFETLLLWYYANTAFEARKKKIVCLGFIFLANVALLLIYQFNIPYINALSLIILYTLLLSTLYNVSTKTAIFHSIIFVIIMLASEIIFMALGSVFFSDFNAMDNDRIAYIYVVITSKLIYFIIIMAILKLVIRNKETNVENRYYWLLFIMPLSSIVMILSFRYVAYSFVLTQNMSFWWIASSILVLFANIIVFMLYEYSNKNTKELYELKTIARQEEQDKRYYDIIEQSNKDMRVLVHDIKNHLSYVQGLDSVKEIHNYIDSLSNDIDKSYYAGISKNKTLDLIIGKYIKLCEANNIKFSVDVKTSNLNYIDSVDLSTFLNNLLDNAFDAAKESKDAFIEFVVFSKNDSYDGLMIRNSCLNAPKTKDGQLVTTKRDKTMHGLGLTSIHKVLKKYNAMLDWKYDNVNHIFETHIVFNKN